MAHIKTSAYLATSLDGFIARSDHGLDWLDGWAQPSQGDYGYADFMSSVDVLLMGRNTFDTVMGFGVDWPYTMPVHVLTTRELTPPPNTEHGVFAISGEPAHVLEQLQSLGFKHVYVDGGQVVQTYLSSGHLDQLILTTLPVLIGDGIPLFGKLERDIKCNLESISSYDTGFVQRTYSFAEEEAP